jgi:hypothetical protein
VFDLELAIATLRGALRGFDRDHDADAMLPSLLAYGRTARHQGITLEDASATFRALFDQLCGREPASVRQRLRRERLVRTLETAYTRPASDIALECAT